MSGIYLHIPFCRQACHYCDFHFSTNLKQIDPLIDAICEEIELRKDYLGEKKMDTIYFGGGTPSLMTTKHLDQIFSEIHQHFRLSENMEVTLEANPEDISAKKIQDWKSLGINRVSLGVQTLNDEKLAFINRAHNSLQAKKSLELIASAFDNFSADLIYAIPPSDPQLWQNDLSKLLSFNPPHVSIYGLTIEEKTVFGRWSDQGKFQEVSENENADAYQLAIDTMEARGYEHYEISNFCKPQLYSKHNTSYWKGEQYLGIGPGAHSFDGKSRSWNVSNNPKYIKAMQSGLPDSTEEILTREDMINELVLTRIRNKWGLDLQTFQSLFGMPFYSINESLIKQLISDELAFVNDDCFYLTKKGWFLADEITERLMIHS